MFLKPRGLGGCRFPERKQVEEPKARGPAGAPGSFPAAGLAPGLGLLLPVGTHQPPGSLGGRVPASRSLRSRGSTRGSLHGCFTGQQQPRADRFQCWACRKRAAFQPAQRVWPVTVSRRPQNTTSDARTPSRPPGPHSCWQTPTTVPKAQRRQHHLRRAGQTGQRGSGATLRHRSCRARINPPITPTLL